MRSSWDAYQRGFLKLMDAIEAAEGGMEALVRAVQCSFPEVTTYLKAREILMESLEHALWDYSLKDPVAFITFFGQRWAPVGAANDPTNLNAHWIGNVTRIYGKA